MTAAPLAALQMIATHALRALFLVAGVTVLVFLLVRAVPGDVVDVLGAEGGLTEAQALALREELGIAGSWAEQFLAWCRAALHGDLGHSLRYRVPVAELVWDALPVTLALAGASLLAGFLLAIALALAATLWPRSLFPRLVDALNMGSIAVPTFCAGLVAILIFSLWLGWLPVIGNFVVPVMVLGLDAAGQIVKPLYEDMKELETAAYIRTARAKGLHPIRIAAFHVLPSAAPILLAMTGLIAASFIGGALTMEVLFGLSGIGSLAFSAINGRDYPVIQAVVLLLAVSVVLINAATDLIQRLIDPRPQR